MQPHVDFRHEVSFVFVDQDFQYALYAPDPARRWVLEPYDPAPGDLEFARRFIEWNTVRHGIQRVDACRTRDGDLLSSSWRTSTRTCHPRPAAGGGPRPLHSRFHGVPPRGYLATT